MIGYVRVVSRLSMLVLMLVLAAATSAQAQTPSPESRFYADFTAAATLGHKSSGSFGVEAGGQVMNRLDVFIETGHMKNVGTSDLDARAATIANAVGASFSTAYKVNYFDAGVRYRPMTPPWPVQPYGLFSVGFAKVDAQTSLSVNGTTVPPESLGVQFGNDLDGSVTKAFIVIGGGALWTIPAYQQRLFLDFGYRYGRILARTSQIQNDTGINTQRIQIGVGIKF